MYFSGLLLAPNLLYFSGLLLAPNPLYFSIYIQGRGNGKEQQKKSPNQKGKGSVARRALGKRVSSGRWSQGGSLLIQSRLGSLQTACPGGQGSPDQVVVLPEVLAPLDESLLPFPEAIFPGGKPVFPPGKIPLPRLGERSGLGHGAKAGKTRAGGGEGGALERGIPGAGRLGHGERLQKGEPRGPILTRRKAQCQI
jgi:hypothetical protein